MRRSADRQLDGWGFTVRIFLHLACQAAQGRRKISSWMVAIILLIEYPLHFRSNLNVEVIYKTTYFTLSYYTSICYQWSYFVIYQVWKYLTDKPSSYVYFFAKESHVNILFRIISNLISTTSTWQSRHWQLGVVRRSYCPQTMALFAWPALNLNQVSSFRDCFHFYAPQQSILCLCPDLYSELQFSDSTTGRCCSSNHTVFPSLPLISGRKNSRTISTFFRLRRMPIRTKTDGSWQKNHVKLSTCVNNKNSCFRSTNIAN
jgi:hypothetical protein